VVIAGFLPSTEGGEADQKLMGHVRCFAPLGSEMGRENPIIFEMKMMSFTHLALLKGKHFQ